MARIHKITNGYVDQTFDENGNLIDQRFVAGDDVEFDIESCDSDDQEALLEKALDFYHDFTMENQENE